jgi:hypothetical protein
MRGVAIVTPDMPAVHGGKKARDPERVPPVETISIDIFWISDQKTFTKQFDDEIFHFQVSIIPRVVPVRHNR